MIFFNVLNHKCLIEITSYMIVQHKSVCLIIGEYSPQKNYNYNIKMNITIVLTILLGLFMFILGYPRMILMVFFTPSQKLLLSISFFMTLTV